MKKQNCKSPNKILEENLVNMHLELHTPMSLIQQAIIISYPRYIYGAYVEPNEHPLCNHSFTQKKLMMHIHATNIKSLYNIPVNGCNNNDIDDAYFSEWINQ